MSGVVTWYSGRSLREKRLLLIMLALAAVTIIWGGIIRPVGDALSSAQSRQVDAVTRLGETRAAVAAVRSAQALRGRAFTGTLADAVRARADAAGFQLTNLDEQAPDRIHVTLTSARPAAIVPWLARLERQGLLVQGARLTDNGDRTVAVDLVIGTQGR